MLVFTGWGEAYSQYDRDTAVMAQLVALGRQGALSTGLILIVLVMAVTVVTFICSTESAA